MNITQAESTAIVAARKEYAARKRKAVMAWRESAAGLMGVACVVKNYADIDAFIRKVLS